ncbi:MAG TPA: RdgB/HAM1 family non-canonical purine NTP pyrophosphatase [Elusimicrobiales bacterium]|nr:RdgB/HAM1 family non-canonical purine NTP pyrophosphatase [Elusimicrobiales bacterium]
MKLLIATGNSNKAGEIIKILPDLNVTYLTLRDFPDVKIPEETGKTLQENAILKAQSACKQSRIASLADDSGLEVDFLNNAPGVYSARYAGENCSYLDNNKKLLQELKNVPLPERGAQFVCVTVVYFPDGKMIMEKGILRGKIVLKPRGINGFGYDPLFQPNGLSKTLAELTAEEKNSISHRFLAVKKIIPALKKAVSLW